MYETETNEMYTVWQGLSKACNAVTDVLSDVAQLSEIWDVEGNAMRARIVFHNIHVTVH